MHRHAQQMPLHLFHSLCGWCHQIHPLLSPRSSNWKETVQSKRNFEQSACAHDVHVHHYQCDNGIYQSKAFQQEIQDNHQS
jgi:hypothetical protein